MEEISTNPYFVGLGMALGVYFSLVIIRWVFNSQLERVMGKNRNRLDDVGIYAFSHTRQFFMVAAAVYAGFMITPDHKAYQTNAWNIFFVLLMVQVAIWGNYAIRKWIDVSISRKGKKDPAALSSISMMKLLVNAVFFSILVIFTLSNLGIKVTTMIAGLGVGGIAVALALQKILGDLFSSLSIVLDKPFVVGDFIIMDTYLGEVEKIGLKTTRIRSLSGEQIIVSNSDLLGARIRNYKRMRERRIVFPLSLRLEMEISSLRKATSIISAIVRSKAKVRLERCHFMCIGRTSLDIETVYWVLSEDYDQYMDVHQEILLDIYQAFQQENIAFAYPTQMVHMAQNEFLLKASGPEGTLKNENQTSLS